MATHSSYFLPGKFHGQRSLVGCSPWGRKKLDTTECVHMHVRARTHTHTHTHTDLTLEQPPKKSHQCSMFLAPIIFLLLHLKFPALPTLHSGECCLGFFFYLLRNHKLPGLVHGGATDGKMDLKEKKRRVKRKSQRWELFLPLFSAARGQFMPRAFQGWLHFSTHTSQQLLPL